MHLPLILNPSGKGKLSKRDGDKNGYPVFPLSWGESSGYRENGFLPEAHLNYIAQLGWSLGEQELMSLKEMEQAFEVKSIQKGGARFDYEKAKWVNQQHLNKIGVKEIVQNYPKYFSELQEKLGQGFYDAIELIKDRLVLLNDIEKETTCFIKDPDGYQEKSMKRIAKLDLFKIGELIKKGIVENDINNLKDYLVQCSKQEDIGLGAFMQVLRIAVVGGLSGPDLMPLVSVIGKDVTLRRLERLINN